VVGVVAAAGRSTPYVFTGFCREGRSLLREGAVVKRLGCRWVYKRELSILKESEGYFYTIRNQFGSSLWWEAPSGDFYI
jgi:hypothetical protein